MNNENTNSTQTKQTHKASFVCFIIGCIIGVISIISCLLIGLFFLNIASQVKAGQGTAAIVTIVIIPIALGCLILSLISSILVRMGKRWKRIPSNIMLAAIVLASIFLIASIIAFIQVV